MNRLPYLFALILFFASCKKKDFFAYPSYETVVDEFFKHYSPEDPAESIRFQKKPDGWHAATMNQELKITRDQLIWSRSDKKFIEPHSSGNHDRADADSRKAQALRENLAMNYTISPYYGYDGWDDDVIDALESDSGLNDTLLYALGRAYSTHAMNLICENSGFKAKKPFLLPDGPDAMSPDQLKEFREYAHLAIETFKKVKDHDPQFQTLIGSIDTKYAHEFVTTFLDLRTFQNEAEAKKELIPGLYNDFILSYAKNTLNSCEKNAILFTYGDTDTFPLLYIQAQYNIRPDVLVVNLSLLQTDRYINSLRKKILAADPLPVSFTPAQIKGEKMEIVMLNDSRDGRQFELRDAIEFLKDVNNTMDIGNGQKYPFLPSKKFVLTNGPYSIAWEANSSYIMKNDLVIMDILSQLKFSRPVYYTATGSPGDFMAINNYLRPEGLVNRLIPAQPKSSSLDYADPDTDLLYERLMKDYDWKGFSTISKNEFSLLSAYRYEFQILTSALISEGKKDSAKMVLDRFVELIPDKVYHYDMYNIWVISSYYQLGETQKANTIAAQLINNINNGIENSKGLLYDRVDKNWQRQSAHYLMSILTANGQADLVNRIKIKDTDPAL
ncbi:MAG: hypothetical protein ACJ77K_01555 [Bacteroidia bacterium]